ncbi:expressed unknown protein [Seminavis robusta]|uniref:Uncharacterized protein n=1 Tax=Seminavis robusta TaxID=568900 RepID=A0A9N8DTG5_9STRA|nr:expressed unknown protein [Seminavis robusta]|eukprot:Sro344_g122291.1  (120) ;mRNA; f:57963-58322
MSKQHQVSVATTCACRIGSLLGEGIPIPTLEASLPPFQLGSVHGLYPTGPKTLFCCSIPRPASLQSSDESECKQHQHSSLPPLFSNQLSPIGSGDMRVRTGTRAGTLRIFHPTSLLFPQ